MSKSIFPDRLAALLQSRSVKQNQLAEAVGITQSDVSRYLQGRVPSADILYRIACHFGVSMDYFFGGAAEPKGWTPGEPLPEKPSLEQLNAMAETSEAQAQALRVGAERFGRMAELGDRIRSIEKEATELRKLIEQMVAAGYSPSAPGPPPALADAPPTPAEDHAVAEFLRMNRRRLSESAAKAKAPGKARADA